MNLNGRIALVSGGSRGIGRAIALGLAADGADVAINYRHDEEAARATVAAIEALGRRARAYAADVGDWEQCAAMAGSALGDFGRFDVLICNAGVASRGQTVVDTDPREPDKLWRTHVYGAWALAKLVVPGMRQAPRGDVVMISSAATRYMAPNSAPYTMAKAALEALAVTLAKEERHHGIHVNVVAPGLVDTDMGRRLVKGAMGVSDIRSMDASSAFGHVCTPEEIADAVRFLVSERAGYVTGQRLGVDGGPF
ncbi:MAG: SDR family oxidoreductase [Deltaproteobacteria bacterium]|nr:SDR family oxidoreductase [Deltaproteobacteria bacterium]